ncbi:hypothetical protein BOTBODRAFT_31311 [Botryobasidium botryosum FD-172 SS1]|uniref:Adenosine deaminase domain-containing protein n=1 Tax=Botryobasidium botryosum (strain FD-172 SS1) TaxID=930990 RepID=A0A067MJD3_BOTB1|nr:hypothetical protein BOTBODRAFT_31311 [Botryobasidium botryosum FD-172 SS1]
MSVAALQLPANLALSSLSAPRQDFIRSLPKAELHAHLNGCIPLRCLQELYRERAASSTSPLPEDDVIKKGLDLLERGAMLNDINDFFVIFPKTIYALTSNIPAISRATSAVLESFLSPGVTAPEDPPQCAYLELRTTPRRTPTRREYLCAVLDEVEKYAASQAALIVSVDRRMAMEDLDECVDLAIVLKQEGRRVVGLDVCGDPSQGDMATFAPALNRAKASGLALTLHIAEIPEYPTSDVAALLSTRPARLGHATFLDPEAQELVRRDKTVIEICLSSNLLCNSTTSLDAHHIQYYLEHDHPIAISTDDTLVFRNTLAGEYALLLAQPPLGLGLSEAEVARVAAMSMDARFL